MRVTWRMARDLRGREEGESTVLPGCGWETNPFWRTAGLVWKTCDLGLLVWLSYGDEFGFRFLA